MKQMLSLISKIYQKGNSFITEKLKQNEAGELVPSHGDILAALYINGKMTMKDIAQKIHRTKPTVTVLVDKLEKSGYVKRETSNKDNRYTYIVLTEKGSEFKPVFEKISSELNELLYKNLSERESIILEELLNKVLKE
ncbi:MarR family transcriptional regulator [bacterium]|nr:MarR family transcriptional regulator [bacterium]